MLKSGSSSGKGSQTFSKQEACLTKVKAYLNLAEAHLKQVVKCLHKEETNPNPVVNMLQKVTEGIVLVKGPARFSKPGRASISNYLSKL